MGLKFPTKGNLRWLAKMEARGATDRKARQTARYYRNLFRATPAWLTDAQKAEMARIYYRAHQRGHVVDHIVPLASPLVCGLHVPWNLAGVPKRVNEMKSNTWWPDAPFEQGGLDFEQQLTLSAWI